MVVVELLDHTVSPRFCRGNEPGLNPIVQAQPYQRAHSTRMSSAAVEGRLVVDLEVLGDTKAVPDTP